MGVVLALFAILSFVGAADEYSKVARVAMVAAGLGWLAAAAYLAYAETVGIA